MIKLIKLLTLWFFPHEDPAELAPAVGARKVDGEQELELADHEQPEHERALLFDIESPDFGGIFGRSCFERIPRIDHHHAGDDDIGSQQYETQIVTGLA